MSNYEHVIRQVRYRHWHPAALTQRRFRLTCSELNGRYTSNEFNLEVSPARADPVSGVGGYCSVPEHKSSIPDFVVSIC